MRIFNTLALLLLAVGLSAAPALKTKMKVRLDNGLRIEVTFCGDEHASYYVSEDGYIVEPLPSSALYRKTTTTVEEFLSALPAPRRAPSRVGSLETAPLPATGSPRVPVLLVNFADVRFSVAETDAGVADYYHLYCNGTNDGKNYTGAGSEGAIRDYFIAQSDSLFSPDFHVLGPVTLSRERAYYGANNGASKDVNYFAFCTESVKLAMEEKGVDWTLFDNDNDGNVDLIYFIFAGLGENVRGGEDAIWPKESTNSTKVNGVTFATSACCNELRPKQTNSNGDVVSTQPDGIGVMCHELSHALGLPDFYDLYGVAFGMDIWSLMDYGCYAKNGYCPVGYTAYERDFMGWRPLQTLDAPTTLHMHALENGGKGYKITTDAGVNEYFILENRNNFGWDKSLATARGHGMLVGHVDYNSSAWQTNKVNTDAKHQRMTIVPANNSLLGIANEDYNAYLNSLAGNPYPGTSGNHELTDTSTPAATTFGGGLLGKPLLDIRETADGVITLKYCPLGTLDAPEVSNVPDDEPSAYRFTAHWAAVENAECYTLEVYTVDGENNYALQFRLDSIADTEKHISGMKPEAAYAYRVKAQADAYLDSPYSDYRHVTMLADAITSPNANPLVAEVVDVYTLQGVRVGRMHRASLAARLRPGFYVLRSSDGQVTKIQLSR